MKKLNIEQQQQQHLSRAQVYHFIFGVMIKIIYPYLCYKSKTGIILKVPIILFLDQPSPFA